MGNNSENFDKNDLKIVEELPNELPEKSNYALDNAKIENFLKEEEQTIKELELKNDQMFKSSPAGLREKLFWREYDVARGILDDTYGKQDMYAQVPIFFGSLFPVLSSQYIKRATPNKGQFYKTIKAWQPYGKRILGVTIVYTIFHYYHTFSRDMDYLQNYYLSKGFTYDECKMYIESEMSNPKHPDKKW